MFRIISKKYPCEWQILRFYKNIKNENSLEINAKYITHTASHNNLHKSMQSFYEESQKVFFISLYTFYNLLSFF